MKRSIWFWLYFVIAIILGVYFATRIFMVSTGHGPLSYVRSLSISADIPNKDLTPVAAAAAVAPGTRAYGATLDAINSRIASTPGVKNAATRRLANGNLTVRVQLYQAVAQWTDSEQYYPLSADGTIVNNPTTTRNPNTVVFRGDVPNDISNITNTAHNMVADLDYLEFIEKRRWNLHTLGGITVMLPERDPAAAIASLMILDKNHKILSRDIDVIDMRDDSRILIK